MNRKKAYVIGSIVILGVLCFSHVAMAGKCRDIVGEWDVIAEQVCGVRVPESFEYIETNATLVITDQNGCLFYGHVLSDTDGILTGVMVNKNLTMTVGQATIVGKLHGKKKMSLIISDHADDPGSNQCTGIGIARKNED